MGRYIKERISIFSLTFARHRVLSFLIICSLVCALLFTLAGCSSDTSPSELKYLGEKVKLSGLNENEITVTIEDLTKLDSVKEKVEAQRSNGEIVKITAVGPTLDTFLSEYGKKQSDFSSIRFSAPDGYSIEIPREILENRNVLLAYMDGNKALAKDAAPLCVVVPGERAMYWVRMIDKIEFETDSVSTSTEKVVFLDTALPLMGGEYSEEEGGDIVSTKELTGKYGGGRGKISMYASDGLRKNESSENFSKGFIKYTGDNIPQFCAPDLPEGMNLNGIVSIRTDNVMYYSLEQAAGMLPSRTSGEGALAKEGIGMTDIAKGNSLSSSSYYEITDKDGNKTAFSDSEIVKGVFLKDKDSWNFYLNEDIQVVGALALEVSE